MNANIVVGVFRKTSGGYFNINHQGEVLSSHETFEEADEQARLIRADRARVIGVLKQLHFDMKVCDSDFQIGEADAHIGALPDAIYVTVSAAHRDAPVGL